MARMQALLLRAKVQTSTTELVEPFRLLDNPGFPVVLTSLADDTVGASVDVLGFPVNDTNVDGSSTTASGW